MDIREIRISNVLKDKSDGHPCVIGNKELISILDGEIDKYEPLPLTESILLICGFKEHEYPFHSKNYVHNFYAYRFVLTLIDDGYLLQIYDLRKRLDGTPVYTIVRYLHHLQNLIVDITGEYVNLMDVSECLFY